MPTKSSVSASKVRQSPYSTPIHNHSNRHRRRLPFCRTSRPILWHTDAVGGRPPHLIKAHKLHLASDRTSCSKATANQFRLLVHTAAYWLMLTLRGRPQNLVLARGPVRHDPPEPDQGRRTRHRNGHPHQNRAADCISLPRRLRHARRPDHQAPAVTDGAVAPHRTLRLNPKPRPPRHPRHRKPCARPPPNRRSRCLVNDPG
jgi:Transposase DDE domain group 1